MFSHHIEQGRASRH